MSRNIPEETGPHRQGVVILHHDKNRHTLYSNICYLSDIARLFRKS